MLTQRASSGSSEQAAQPAAARIVAAGQRADARERRRARAHGRGSFLSVLTNPTERILVLKVGRNRLRRRTSTPTRPPDALDQIRPGSLVAVTGVYSYQWRTAAVVPAASCVRPTTCACVAAAPWWTMRHTAVMVAMLGARRRAARWSGCGRRREAQAAAVSGGAERADPRRRASCTTRSSRGWRHRAAARGGGRQPRGLAGRGARSRSTSRARCCATAWRRRAAR